MLSETLKNIKESVERKRHELRKNMSPKEQIRQTFEQGNEFIQTLNIEDEYCCEISTVLEILAMDFESLINADSKYHKKYLAETIKLLQRLEAKIKESEK